MSARAIVLHPDEILRRVADPVTQFDASLTELTENLTDTLKHEGGIGLCAPQIANSARVLAALLGDSKTPEIFINPEITAKSKPGYVQESCLSLPGIKGNVVRHTAIEVSALNVHGDPFHKTLTGMDAVCLQHEIDHLNGILFIDRFSSLKKMLMRLTGRGVGQTLDKSALQRP